MQSINIRIDLINNLPLILLVCFHNFVTRMLSYVICACITSDSPFEQIQMYLKFEFNINPLRFFFTKQTYEFSLESENEQNDRIAKKTDSTFAESNFSKYLRLIP